jgi:hypothetical protein
VLRDGCFFQGVIILISTFCVPVCAYHFQGLSKAFHYHIQVKLFICFFEIEIPFSVIGRCSQVPTSHWQEQEAGGFRYDFTESQAASCINISVSKSPL